MKITSATYYAIVASSQLSVAGNGATISCKQLAKLGELPERFLLQILRQLVDHGLLESLRGVDGGYRLAKPAQSITLLDIVNATGANSELHLPPMAELDGDSRKSLHSAITNVYNATQEELRSIKLADLRPRVA